MESYTIAEDFVLPSEGKIYPKPVDANIKLRSMTTEEEMKRLGHSPYHYKLFSEMIDDCIVSDEPKEKRIQVYDMCLADYQYLLYKLRTVTYGADYAVSTICPYCGKINTYTIDLDSLKIKTYDESLKKLLELELPVTKKIVKLKWQTPRIIDETEKRVQEQNSQSSDSAEFAVLFNVVAQIDTVDGETWDDTKKELFVRKLPMKDTNAIIQRGKKLILSLGLDTKIHEMCSGCKSEFDFSLPINGEFFGPAED